MRTSEHDHPASDDVMREVVHQLADSAPLAPEWHELSGRSLTAPPPPSGHLRRNLVLVAAVTALLVGGLWLLRSPGSDVPADVPVVTVPATPVQSDAAADIGLSDLDPIEAQLCLTRKNVRLLVAAESELVTPDSGLVGYTPDRARLTLFAPPVVVFASLLDHPDLDIETGERLDDLLELSLRADALAFAGSEGGEGAGFAAAVDDLILALGDEVATITDPPLCTVDLDGASDTDPARSYGRCVAAVRLDVALDQLSNTGADADMRVVTGAADALRGWYDPVPADVAGLVALTDELAILPVDRRPASVAPLRAELEPLWADQDAPCAEEFVEP